MVKAKNIVCSQCGSRFKTANALAQHSRTVHTVSGPARRIPSRRAVRPKRTTPGMGTGQVVSGGDRISAFSIAAGVGQGAAFSRIALAPGILEGTRLHAHSRLWARWRPLKLELTVTLAGASTTFGSYCFGWSPEVDFQISTPAETLAKRVEALRPSVECRGWETKKFSVPCETSRKWYHTIGSADESSHGTVVGCVSSIIGGYTGNISVVVHLNWTVQFEGIDLEPTASGDVKDAIKPDVGWKHIFTTSDSGWDAARLTFKMVSGGSMVPFSAAQPHHVYQPTAGTKVQYKDEAGALHDALWFVVIQGYPTPGLALCANKTDAIEYIKTGDDNKLLPYAAAGPFVTPETPTFEGTPAAMLKDDEDSNEVNSLRLEIEDLRLKVKLMEAASPEN